MTVLELFRKYDFESILPHFDHLFEVNSKYHLSDASIEVFRGIYNHWANECETKPTKYQGGNLHFSWWLQWLCRSAH